MRRAIIGAVLVLAGACGTGPAERSGAPASAPPPPPQTAVPAPPATPAVLSEAMAGWTRAGALQRFGPGNLWEYINGGAEQYLSFGFQDLQSARFTREGGLSAVVDVYRLDGPLQAFGIYAHESNPKRTPLAVGVDGRAGRDAVEFWAASSYVKLTVAPPGPEAVAALTGLARAVAAALGDPGGRPPELAMLPAAGLVEGSTRLVPEDALGQAAFAGALEAKYAGTPDPSTLLLVPFASPEAAAAALRDYVEFLAAGQAAPVPASGLGHGAVTAADRYYGRVVAATAGRWLVLSLGAPPAAGEALVRAAAARVTAPAAQPEGGRR
jgi:hypothetical protein